MEEKIEALISIIECVLMHRGLVKPYANTNVFFKLGLVSNSTKSN